MPDSGASVYGTDAGFAGHVQPGNQFSADLAFEYSLTRNWVPALDLIYSHGNAGFTRGLEASGPIFLDSGSSDAFGFAPTLEYNWSSNLGILAGVRIFPAGHNSRASVTPAIAINYVD